MTDTQRQWLRRALAGGGVGCAVHLLLCALVLQASQSWLSATPASPLAVAEGLLLALALGAAVGVSTLPFDVVGKALALRSLAHFLATGGLTLAYFWRLGWAKTAPAFTVLFGLYAFVYLVVWLARWVGWWAELADIRAKLGLTEEERSPLGWREDLPYLLFLAAFFLLARPLLAPLDGIDVPVLTGILLPWLGYPFVAFVVALLAGGHNGFSPLPPLAVGLAFLPNLLYFSPAYDWSQVVAYALCTLLGEAVGAAWRWAKGRRKAGG